MDIAHVYETERKAYEGMVDVYFRWCKGKEYMKDGVMYHSGYKKKEV